MLFRASTYGSPRALAVSCAMKFSIPAVCIYAGIIGLICDSRPAAALKTRGRLTSPVTQEACLVTRSE